MTEKQSRAAESNSKHTLVVAGAGTGKTTTLVGRIKFLVEKQNISEKRIAAITFTRMAALELKTRCKYNIFAGTIHSFCYQNIKKYFQKFNIINDRKNNQIIKEMIVEKIEDERFKDYINFKKSFFKDKNEFVNDLFFLFKKHYFCTFFTHYGYIPIIEGLTDREYNNEFLEEYSIKTDEKGLEERNRDSESTFYIELYKEYWNFLYSNLLLTFDAVLLFTYAKLLSDKNVLMEFSNKYDHILIDEFQDVDFVQYQILTMIANNLYAVGDDDQSIYGFRGSYPEIFLKYKQDFSPDIFILDENFRSTQDILDVANEIIKKNIHRIEKNLIAVKNKTQGFVKSNVFKIYDTKEYFRKIVDIINNEIVPMGYKHKDIAILTRKNIEIKHIGEALLSEGIPYITSRSNILDRKNIGDFILFLQLIDNPTNNYLFITACINYVTTKSTITMTLIKQYYENTDRFFYIDLLNDEIPEDLKRARSIKRIKMFAETISEYRETLSLEEKTIAEFCYGVLNKFQSFFDEEQVEDIINFFFPIAEKIFSNTNDLTNLIEYFLSQSSVNEEGGVNLEHTLEEDSVYLLTVHASKGLEFPVVIIPSFFTNNFEERTEMTIFSGEERRLCYVAITRAKDCLYIVSPEGVINLYPNKRNKDLSEWVKPSHFFDEIAEVLLKRKIEKGGFYNLIDNISDKSSINYEEKYAMPVQKTIEEINNFKLKICLVPRPLWRKSLANYFKNFGDSEIWKKIRSFLYRKEGNTCWICGEKAKWLEAHEFWHYDDINHIQKLESIHLLCPMCHKVVHFGRSTTRDGIKELESMGLSVDDLIVHFCKVNDCTIEDFEKHRSCEFSLWEKRNKYEWQQDVSWFNELWEKIKDY